ncbi:hypothetical protein [Kitasatospora sp. NPDC057500]|uniref:hypothetical protein n=1 Tax=Kitasatospora sp. NPDC057500 TaxID=3346151 RepID=UPI00369E7794
MAVEDPVGVAEIVHGCLRWDWRWDGLDERGVYLARLVRDLGLELGPVVEGLAGGEERCERAARVLELLALSGSWEAREALREYVGEGEHWRDVLEEMAREWPVGWWEDLGAVVRARMKGDEADLWGEPWARWGMETRHPEDGPGSADPLAAETNARLVELLADPGERGRWGDVVRLLARREPEPGLLPWVPSLGSADGERPLPLLPRAVRILGAAAVPAAREWVAAEQEWLAGLGHTVLADFGDVEDIPVLVAGLERDWVEKRWCGPDRTARGLTRFGREAREAASLLRRFWLWTPHSYERAGYLEALAAIDPAGLDGIYVECLWDCEDAARLMGVERAPDQPDVRERLAYLRDDAMETAEVRAAASARLAALTGKG